MSPLTGYYVQNILMSPEMNKEGRIISIAALVYLRKVQSYA